MDETASYPPIEPSNFDLIVIGTGLPESIIAAAAAATGKTVLHLDPNPFYGSHYASLPLHDFVSLLQSHSKSTPQPPSFPNPDNDAYAPLLTRPFYFAVEVNSFSSEPLDSSRHFSIDLAGPRVLFCADPMIDLILRTGINQYMEFKSVDASFVADAQGNLGNVPDSRSAIFKDRSLSFPEKNQLMKFFKLVQGHFGNDTEEDRISAEDLESPFVDFLNKIGLSDKLKSIILYSIVLADYDQDGLEVSKNVIDTKRGITRLALYNSSIGRFPNANGAMLYPVYGQGELPQAFCRRAAVKGSIYVLRMPTVAVIVDKDNGTYKGIKLVSGQELFSPLLILAPSFSVLSLLAPSPGLQSHDSLRNVKGKVARGICISKNSFKPDIANCLVVFPPRTLYPEQITSVRVLQLSGTLAVGPSGMFLTYLSAVCDNAVEGKKLLIAAINALFCMPISGKSENSDNHQSCEQTEAKPSLLWSALYMQELALFQEAFNSIHYTPVPDEHLDYISLVDATEKLFREIYPDEDFLKTSLPGEPVEDGGTELDS